jgi:2-polyprenyl-3-methyl-5-hydroxy-6-metoxy-1,4-benzoquinol methylase
VSRTTNDAAINMRGKNQVANKINGCSYRKETGMATAVDTDRIVHMEGYTMQALQQLPEKHIVSPERNARVLSTASVLSSPYDRIAPWYDEGIRLCGSIHDLVLPGVLELIGNMRGMEICDLACGQGVLARRLAGQGAKVVGVDLSLELLKIAGREEQSEPLGIRYLLCSSA